MDESPVSRVTSALEDLAKTAGVVAVFGYMSLRARFNYLGFSSMSSLGAERYLMEAYSLLMALLLPLTVACLLYGFAYIFVGVPLAKRLADWVQPRRTRVVRIAMMAIFVAATITFVLAVQSLTVAGSDVLVGPLEPSRAGGDRPIEAPGVAWIVLTAMIVAATLKSADERAAARERVAWNLVTAALALVALTIPLLHGTAAQPSYPVATVMRDGKPPLCGALVLETGEALSLWRARARLGEVLTVRKDTIEMTATGELVDLIDLARSASADSKDQPVCPVFP